MADLRSNSHHIVEPTPKRKRSGFSSLDGRSVAVILRPADKQFVFLGTAAFQCDDVLGNILIISALDSQPTDPKLIFSEREWKGRIIPDLEYGCELCMIPTRKSGDAEATVIKK